VKRIIVHAEALAAEGADPGRISSLFDRWKLHGAEIGIALLMSTPVEALQHYAHLCDEILVMSIKTIGAMGAAFEPSSLERIAALHAAYPKPVMAVDGGVNATNIQDLVRAGATRFGVGSAISKTSDPTAAYNELKSLAECAVE
jgi:ribulose-phosphate 3-epimerase